MRLLLRRFPVAGGLFFLALLCLAAIAAPKYFHGNTATITVTNTNDSGPGSLRQALVDVPDGGMVQFDSALNGQTIILTSAELYINKSITISGPGPSLLRLTRSSTGQLFRIFHLMPSPGAAAIRGLTINGGYAGTSQLGGGIFNDSATL